jgi:alpha-glucosidase (family GH31 glycosyl hydrolase)
MFALLVALFALLCGAQELLPYNPVPKSAAVVVAGFARFTVLTERVIRCEHDSRGLFETRPSLAVVNRALPVPRYSVQYTSSTLQLNTSKLQLTYVLGQRFSSASLRITGANFSWRFGDVDGGNLLGTIRSLDNLANISLNCSTIAGKKVHGESLHCRYGVVSKSGWAVLDDSDNYMLDQNGTWWESPNSNQVDVYLFGHGRAYLDAIQDFTLLSGRVPMVPRGAVGIMWSRWFDYTGADAYHIVEDYESRGLPLDALILDMDWHTKPAWGSYT